MLPYWAFVSAGRRGAVGGTSLWQKAMSSRRVSGGYNPSRWKRYRANANSNFSQCCPRRIPVGDDEGGFTWLRRPVSLFRLRWMMSLARGSHLSRLDHTAGDPFLSAQVRFTPSCNSRIRLATEQDKFGSRSSSRDIVW